VNGPRRSTPIRKFWIDGTRRHWASPSRRLAQPVPNIAPKPPVSGFFRWLGQAE
jgi:hypothetical protein